MNIFYLSQHPGEAAKFHNDKHTIKMILESAQLLSTAHRVLDGELAPFGVYKATHINHPCAIWVRSGIPQYSWTANLFTELMKEYTHRYGKHHACEKLAVILHRYPLNIPDATWSDPPQCMPDDCKVDGDPVKAYRNYYIKHKSGFANWRNRNIPIWFHSECGG